MREFLLCSVIGLGYQKGYFYKTSLYQVKAT